MSTWPARESSPRRTCVQAAARRCSETVSASRSVAHSRYSRSAGQSPCSQRWSRVRRTRRPSPPSSAGRVKYAPLQPGCARHKNWRQGSARRPWPSYGRGSCAGVPRAAAQCSLLSSRQAMSEALVARTAATVGARARALVRSVGVASEGHGVHRHPARPAV